MSYDVRFDPPLDAFIDGKAVKVVLARFPEWGSRPELAVLEDAGVLVGRPWPQISLEDHRTAQLRRVG